MKNHNIDIYINIMQGSKLFKAFCRESLEALLKSSFVKISYYESEDVIYSEGDKCTNLSLVLQGEVEIQKLEPSGKVLTVSNLNEGEVFGENLLFGDKNFYPMDVISKKNSTVLHITKAYVERLCRENADFLNTILRILSNKAVALSSKLKQIGLKSLRQKICDYLYTNYKDTGSNNIRLNMSKKDWAEKLGVERPSLSRELIKMKEEGIIEYDKENIRILDADALEDALNS
ncbi:Crp/Fnr family transcriptional regulator [Clostridium polynesiense]|uniref:Crp/Fnr family transcriptional regulator n=1 Tax=Clostridium polynesiense TaxID=1325933 RepID=UPI000B2EFE6E|nr:Crp/Fnr family transcriptional regulator [Clostridium polynesiense]